VWAAGPAVVTREPRRKAGLARSLDRLTRRLRLAAVDVGILEQVKDRLARDERLVGEVLPDLRATVERLNGTW
jgi:hypothetical protein